MDSDQAETEHLVHQVERLVDVVALREWVLGQTAERHAMVPQITLPADLMKKQPLARRIAVDVPRTAMIVDDALDHLCHFEGLQSVAED